MARRRYTPKLKAQVVLEVLEGDKTPGQVAKAYGVHPNSVGLWKRRFIERAPEIFADETTVNGTSVASGIWSSCWARRRSRSRS